MSKYLFISVVLTTLIAGCGGGGSDAGTASSGPTTTTLQASGKLANLCAAPRAGVDKLNFNQPYPDKQGTLSDEKAWLRSWIDETYLWYKEVPTVNAANYSTAIAYFDALKSPATTPSGKAKDQFHFTYASADWDALSQQGAALGYGINWAKFTSSGTPRKWVVTMVEPNSPAALMGMLRGDELVSVDNADFVYGSDTATINTLNAGLFPASINEIHKFVIKRNSSNFTFNLTATTVISTPVQNVKTIDTPTGKVGYLTFNSHISTAEPQLMAAISSLKAANISDLVLDLRYNGGGLLSVASELAYMIAGPQVTSGKTFEQVLYNDKTPAESPTPFISTSQQSITPRGVVLPYLGLKKLTILTSAGTCSASESIINSLQGIDIEVTLVGGTTCGKPYGFYPAPNCGTTYFAIQFKGVNNKGFGDYSDGIPAACAVADDLTRALGDPAESQLAAALSYRTTKTCPAATVGVTLQNGVSAAKLEMVRPMIKEITVYDRVQ